MNFLMHKQKPRPKVTPLHGDLAIGNGEAQFFSPDHKLLAELSKPEMMWAGAKGIMMRGFEPNGNDREGNQKYIYQEWFLRYPEENQMQRFSMVATENGEELQPIAKGELVRVKDLIAWLDAQGDAAMEQARTLREGTDEHSTIGNVVQHYRFVATSLRLEFDDDSRATP